MSQISVDGLTKRFSGKDGFVGVDDVTFAVPEGEVLVLLGPSGCGKTTTLRCLAGLEQPTSGVIHFGSDAVWDSARQIRVPTHKRDLGMVFQTFALWPHLTGWRNIRFALESRGVPRAERDAHVQAIADLVDLDVTLLKKRPGQLSGGQQQRVALARALVASPKVVLFDEPLSNLDALLREQLRSELRQLHRRLGFTAVYVTHDLVEAVALGDKVAVMRAGKIEQHGRPGEVFDAPATPAVARLLGHRSLGTFSYDDGQWHDEVGSKPVDAQLAEFLSRKSVGGRVQLFATPPALRCRSLDNAPAAGFLRIHGGVLREALTLGSSTEYAVEIGGALVRIPPSSDGQPSLSVGRPIAVDADMQRVVVFGGSERVAMLEHEAAEVG